MGLMALSGSLGEKETITIEGCVVSELRDGIKGTLKGSGAMTQSIF